MTEEQFKLKLENRSYKEQQKLLQNKNVIQNTRNINNLLAPKENKENISNRGK